MNPSHTESHSTSTYNTYTSIVIAGGAMKVMSVIGVIRFLEEHKLVKDIKNYVVTSAGAIISLLMALNFNSQEIKKLVLDNLQDNSLTTFDADGILDMVSTYGINNGEALENTLDKLIKKKYPNVTTFLDFTKATGKNLVICVSNLTKENHEFFSVDSTPQISVAKAVRTSCSIPVMFCPVYINGDLFLDGGLFNNFPIDYFHDNKLHDILAINITTKNYQRVDNFFQYLRFIINSVIKKFNQKSINNEDRNVLTLEFEDNDSWFTWNEIKISLSKEQLDEYIELGYREANVRLTNT